jgi:CheY-like chemotaxis protein
MRYRGTTGSEVNASDCFVIELSIQLGSALKGMRILVVEDSWQVAIALKRLLQTLGAEVVGPVACTGDAERVISERLPDAAIVDINLRAGERAYGLIDQLLDKGIRVVVTSGYSNLSNLPEKVAGILQKPVEAAQLLAVLQTSRTDVP